ncbi:hypothetical protein GCM10023144_04640 [Pigmentiphaga soli]|uniref:GAF domain-containing protein n=1 Tax=Pigmentiphaga soli TaxID=1007095 RepID=A0ABP8GGM4_9BURK
MTVPPFPAASSHYANRAAAEQAVRMALPLIEAAMRHAYVGESGFLYIVVMDPALGPSSGCDFEQAVLYEHAVGDRERWDADYAAFARGKAMLSWRTGMDSHRVQALYPHLLRGGDSTLWGSVCVDGIVVGVSGANPWYDEAFAGTVAYCLKAVAKGRATTETRGLTLG